MMYLMQCKGQVGREAACMCASRLQQPNRRIGASFLSVFEPE